MFSCLLANKNKIPRYESTNEQPRTKKIRTGHLRICVSDGELKKSQPQRMWAIEYARGRVDRMSKSIKIRSIKLLANGNCIFVLLKVLFSSLLWGEEKSLFLAFELITLPGHPI